MVTSEDFLFKIKVGLRLNQMHWGKINWLEEPTSNVQGDYVVLTNNDYVEKFWLVMITAWMLFHSSPVEANIINGNLLSKISKF